MTDMIEFGQHSIFAKQNDIIAVEQAIQVANPNQHTFFLLSFFALHGRDTQKNLCSNRMLTAIAHALTCIIKFKRMVITHLKYALSWYERLVAPEPVIITAYPPIE